MPSGGSVVVCEKEGILIFLEIVNPTAPSENRALQCTGPFTEALVQLTTYFLKNSSRE